MNGIKINLKKFALFFSKHIKRIKILSVNKINDKIIIKFSYVGDLTPELIDSIGVLIKKELNNFVDEYNVELDSENNIKNENTSLSYGVIHLVMSNKVTIMEGKNNEPIFVKKFNEFINNLWKNSVEKRIVDEIYKYRKLISKDPEKGKQYLNDVYLNNKDLIDSNASLEFKNELSNLINEYKVDDQLNELEDHTKYFNKNVEKLYSDTSYFGESNNKKMKNKNLNLIKRIDDFFYIAESEEALSNWENYKREILKEKTVTTWEDYSKISSLKEEINMAAGLMRLHNLMPRAEKFLQKENYLYRPTNDYCYKVDMNLNPYADKEGSIYFDNEDSARLYADSSKGKYEYKGKSSIKESVELNEENDTDALDVKIYSTTGKLSKGQGTAIFNILKNQFQVTRDRIKVNASQSEIFVKGLELSNLVPLDRKLKGVDKSLDVKTAGFYSDDKYFNAEKGEYTLSESTQLNELNLDTYAKVMDNTDSHPYDSPGKNKDKRASANSNAKELFVREFYKTFPKEQTKINLIGKKSGQKYFLTFSRINLKSNFTNYDLIFTINNKYNDNITISNPLYISSNDLRKISEEPLQITSDSKKIINNMFSYGLSKSKTNKGDIDEGLLLSESDNEDSHIKPYEDWKELKDTDVLTEDTTTADMAIPDMPIIKRIDETTFKTSYKNETPELINGKEFESKLMKFDPYKNASNIVAGSKTKIKTKFDCLYETYSIKEHNLKEKKVDKFNVIIENDYKERKIVSFNKKDFAKFIFESRQPDVRFIKEGKFDYYRYMDNQTFGSTNSLIREYFDSKS